MEIVSQEQLRALVVYHPERGIFTRVKDGSVCGYICATHGYVLLMFGRKIYRAHRLAWLYMTGRWPANLIDHKNRRKNDNRWSNLREATPAQNNYNRVTRPASGIKGVRKDFNRWVAMGSRNGKTITIGRFDTKEEAHAAYVSFTKPLAGEFFTP